MRPLYFCPQLRHYRRIMRCSSGCIITSEMCNVVSGVQLSSLLRPELLSLHSSHNCPSPLGLRALRTLRAFLLLKVRV